MIINSSTIIINLEDILKIKIIATLMSKNPISFEKQKIYCKWAKKKTFSIGMAP